MLDRISKRRQEFDVHPHNWDIRKPLSKRLSSRSSSGFPAVPSPSVFRDVDIPYSLTRNSTAPPNFEQYPAPGHVAAHLLLTECFQKLRNEVESSSKLKGEFQRRDCGLSQIPNLTDSPAWTSYLALAIKRFRLWITKIESVIRHSSVFNRYGTGSHLHGAFTENYLPPIDVLFIWYTYLQRPAAYGRLIASNDFKLLSQICFPWHLFPTNIDQNTLEYNFPLAAKALWSNLVGIPWDLQDCIDHDFDNDAAAFMTAPTEMLNIALRQSDLIERFCQHQWLRSPSLYGTIQRAMSRYTDQIMSISNRTTERTQQIPIDVLESRNIEELDLDLPSRLIMQTHRAYHSAWQVFMQLNNLEDEESPPPPSYAESNENENEHLLDQLEVKSLNSCYCWVCERIKDELSTVVEQPSFFLEPLNRVSSPEDEKRTLSSISSSDSEEASPTSDLKRRQIRTIKEEIALYRQVEALRVKRMAR